METPYNNSDVDRARDELVEVVGAFKKANDERIEAIEKRQADVLLSEKVERLSARLDEHKTRLDRFVLAGQRPRQGVALEADERKTAIERYMRSGETQMLAALQTKALNAGVDAEGGYLAPEPTERIIAAALRDISPVRQIASVREIGSIGFKKPVSLGGASAGWVAETATRPQTATPTLSAIDFPTMELYAMPAASQTLLDDAIVDIEQWLADEVMGEFAAQETDAFVNGDGVAKPKGFLSYPIAEESVRTQSQIGYVATGAAGAFAATDPSDKLLDLIYAPKQVYRANARFVMNRRTLTAVRKFKDADGNYLWQPGLAAGQPSTLMGYPVTEIEEMPDIGANAHAIGFGDFARLYLIVDRQGVKILRDPYSAKPYVLFYTTRRVGGGVQDFDAVKLLKFAAA